MRRNPRVVVLAGLKAVNQRLRFMVGSGRWGQNQQVHDGRWRKRRPEEQIENNLNAWYELRVELKGMVDQLVALDEIARMEVERIRNERERAREEEEQRERDAGNLLAGV